MFDIALDLIIGLSPTTFKTRHVLYRNPSILVGNLFVCCDNFSHTSCPPCFCRHNFDDGIQIHLNCLQEKQEELQFDQRKQNHHAKRWPI